MILSPRKLRVPALMLLIAGVALGSIQCASDDDDAATIPLRELNAFESTYVKHVAPVGAMHVIDIDGMDIDRQHIAATLQGTINRTEARIFLSDDADSFYVNDFWIDYYTQEHGIELAWRGDLVGALEIFANEVDGYILYSEDEHWSVNIATTIGSMRNAIVVEEDDAAFVESFGLTMLESVVGRWPDSVTAYAEATALYYDQMPHPSPAVAGEERYELRDFAIQQGMFMIHAQPNDPDWEVIPTMLNTIAENIPVLGYMSANAIEEVLALATVSQANKYLVPTATTANLSFHSSVPAPASPEPALSPVTVDPCPEAKLVVTVAISDGDNVRVPLSYPKWDGYWKSNRRGELPIGWSLNDSLFALAPAPAHYLKSNLAPGEELVSLMGLGYVLNNYHPNPEENLRISFDAMADNGLDIYWTLTPSFEDANDALWDSFANARTGSVPDGVLVSYRSLLGVVSFRTSQNVPVLVCYSDYEDNSADFATLIRELLAMDDADRPEVVFMSATSWNHSYDSLVENLLPLEAEGVCFVKPSDALAMVR